MHNFYFDFYIDNNMIFFGGGGPNQHVRMIYEGSCETEDWS